MTCLFYNKDPLAIVNNMGSYFKQVPPDCTLFSEDGFEIPVHKELLYQTRFLRRMLKSANMDNFKIEIMIPSISKEELKSMINFLYSGKMYCPDQTFATQVFDNLTELFGFPSKNFDFNGMILENETQDESKEQYQEDTYMESEHSALIRNLIKLKGTAKLIVQGEWVCLQDFKYILFEILANRTWMGCASSFQSSKPKLPNLAVSASRS